MTKQIFYKGEAPNHFCQLQPGYCLTVEYIGHICACDIKEALERAGMQDGPDFGPRDYQTYSWRGAE